jgi:hypothetical protein
MMLYATLSGVGWFDGVSRAANIVLRIGEDKLLEDA